MSFSEMSFPIEVERALDKLKFKNPTEIQKETIPLLLGGADLMACAETGSGKSGAYGIPLVLKLLENPKQSALVLVPTRELAHQVSDFLRELTDFCRGFRVTALIGGADIRKQLMALKKNPRIVVATPGRLIDHLKRRSFRPQSVGFLVLDEGDRMLDMGFAPQLNEILKYLPQERQTSLFTATLPEKVRKLAASYLKNPQSISVGRTSQPVSSIRQSVVKVSFKGKDELIIDELNKRDGSIIIFSKTQNRTDILAKNLESYGFKVDLIHGGRSQGQRNRAIQNFKSGRSRILCATDIAARGIDIPQVRHVINFDLPMMDEDYVHRIGRTARNGADGEALSFVTPQEVRSWMGLVKKYQITGANLQVEGSGKSSKSARPQGKSGKGRLNKRWSKPNKSGGGKKSGRSFRSASR